MIEPLILFIGALIVYAQVFWIILENKTDTP